MSCTLKDPEIEQCCCNCEYLHPVHHHCTTYPKPVAPTDSKCVCGVQKSWACVPPGTKRVYDNWPEHSAGCEYYTSK